MLLTDSRTPIAARSASSSLAMSSRNGVIAMVLTFVRYIASINESSTNQPPRRAARTSSPLTACIPGTMVPEPAARRCRAADMLSSGQTASLPPGPPPPVQGRILAGRHRLHLPCER
jgi:hypothetical protein